MFSRAYVSHPFHIYSPARTSNRSFHIYQLQANQQNVCRTTYFDGCNIYLRMIENREGYQIYYGALAKEELKVSTI